MRSLLRGSVTPDRRWNDDGGSVGQFANENGRWVSLRIGFRRFFRESFCFRKLFGTLAILALWLRVAVPRSAKDGSPPPLMVAEHGSGAWWRCSPPPLMVAVPGCLLPACWLPAACLLPALRVAAWCCLLLPGPASSCLPLACLLSACCMLVISRGGSCCSHSGQQCWNRCPH